MTTGYVYDPIFLKHTKRGHPESAHRLETIMFDLESSGLLAELQLIPARAATMEELSTVHTMAYIYEVEQISLAGDGYLDMDTYVTRSTYEAATVAAGSTIDLTLAVCDDIVDNGFALVRPPGHHALSDQGMGFCVFNNIVLAARMAQQKRGLERVAIIDFDVHHGNGTQPLTEDDPTILYISTHQYPFYPGTGGMTEVAPAQGRGTLLNLPLRVNVGDEGFKALYTEIVVPALRRFRPQLILVSAGYDAHWADPLASMSLSLTGYTWISKTLVAVAQELCGSKLVFVLEGGYNLEVLSAGVANTFRALLGRDDFVDPFGPADHPEPDLSEYLMQVKRVHGL